MFKFYSFSQDTPSDTWTVNHNRNSEQVTIEVMINIGGNLEKILPYDIVAANTNTLVVTFTSPQTGKATVAGGG